MATSSKNILEVFLHSKAKLRWCPLLSENDLEKSSFHRKRAKWLFHKQLFDFHLLLTTFLILHYTLFGKLELG